jgi:hypothetical protein
MASLRGGRAVASSGIKRRVLPVLLIDFDEETDAAGPLTGFQLTMATRDGFFKVVCAMNDLRSGKPVQEEILAERVDTFWPRIQEAVDEVRRADAPPTSRRDSAQLLGEVLRIVRGLGSQESADLDQSALTEGISNQILKKLSAADDGSGTSWTIFDHAVRNLAERLRATYNPDFLVGVYPEGGFIGYLLWLDSNRAWPLLLAPDADKPPLPEEIAAIGARVADICRGKTAPRGLIVDAAMKSGRTMRSTRELVLRACGERGIEPQLETLCLSVRDGYGLSHADRPTFFSLGGDYDLPFGS